jgi:hypothetical protein
MFKLIFHHLILNSTSKNLCKEFLKKYELLKKKKKNDLKKFLFLFKIKFKFNFISYLPINKYD